MLRSKKIRQSKKQGTLPFEVACHTFLMLVTLNMALPGMVLANDTDPARLEELETEIGNRVMRRQALDAQAAALAQEVNRIRQSLIDAAARVQARERDVTSSETRIAGLEAAQAVLLARLETRRSELTDTLAALQRLDRNPPPALAIKPDDAVSAMRSALLLSTIVPELEAQAQEIQARLKELDDVRASLLAERETFGTASAELEAERAELNELLKSKQTAQAAVISQAEEEAAALARLSKEAAGLKDLIARLEARARSRTPVPRPLITTPHPGGTSQPERPPSQNLIAAIPGHLFSASRGLIRPPVEGIAIRNFGANDGAGGTTRGITLETRPQAPVTAPFDGRIAFAGPFRQYGQLLILEVGEGYHLLLAGLARIDGVVGQNVLAGEPIGTMGTKASESSRSNGPQTSGNAKPALYIEIRRNGNPVDPRPWFVDSDRKARG